MPTQFNDEILKSFDEIIHNQRLFCEDTWGKDRFKADVTELVKSFLLTTITKVREDAISGYQTNFEQQHIASAIRLAREDEKGNLLSQIKGLGREDGIDLVTIAKVLNRLNKYE